MIDSITVHIDLPHPNSLHRRYMESKECWIKLYDTYIEFKTSATFEADDLYDMDEIWKPVRGNSRWTRRRSDLSTVDMYFDNPENMWMVCIDFSGVSQSTGWLFEDPKSALKVYNQLSDYLKG